ncbi:LOB domain-containing protein 27-like [Cornus florida]|uniref:LOB domain-containing protein 27-like n=1 Tax=Cornus florida TaxID=4283 RepID=UPI00289E4018|nr:LOB domain-containing protein 27-like [Cornus florida]
MQLFFSSSVTLFLPFTALVLLLLSLSLVACRSLLLVPKMTVKGGTSQACAACKYQRRKCSSECALAPYFPANEPKMFQNAHRLFGVCNIMKILKQCNSREQKDEAMKSIIYESDIRQKCPVYGCWGIICQLQYQLRQAIEELRYVHARLTVCREQCHNQMNPSPHFDSPSSQLQLGISPTSEDSSIFQHHGMSNFPIMNHFGRNEMDGVYFESNDNNNNNNMSKPLLVQQYPYYNNMASGGSSMGMGMGMGINQTSQMVPSQPFFIQHATEVSQDYDDIPFDTIADDRQSYIESKEACESSSESSLKDTTQLIHEHASKSELKSAAACFSLTSVN